MELHGFGEERARAVSDFFADERHRAVLREADRARRLAGRSRRRCARGRSAACGVCVTGTLSRPRSDIQADIEAAGGIFDKSVKKGTTYLVAGADVGATKLKDAQKKGVQVIDEAALEKLLRGEPLDPAA